MYGKAVDIIKRLKESGFEAYFVGGMVRDILLGREIKDIDIATNALPEEVIRIFPGSRMVGARFGVVIVTLESFNYEIATFRTDGEYIDGRRPESVRFTNVNEDVFRRDFTVNGMLLDPITDKITDLVEGRKDLKKKTVRAIGDPQKRFTEDKLRMLRAVRFAACLEFEIDKKTLSAVKKLADKINIVSRERIKEEINLILISGFAGRGFKLLDECGLLAQILPDISAMKGVKQPPDFHPEGDVFTHTKKMLEYLKKDCSVELALGALLHDVAKPVTYSVSDRIRFNNHPERGAEMAENICRGLRYPESTVKQVSALVKNHLRFKDVQNMKLSTFKKFVGLNKFDEHLELHRLDCVSSHSRLDNYNFTLEKIRNMKPEDIDPPKLINGNDLINAGYSPGPEFKNIIEYITELQLNGKIKTKEEAMNIVQKRFNAGNMDSGMN